jgi:hypothetical protein
MPLPNSRRGSEELSRLAGSKLGELSPVERVRARDELADQILFDSEIGCERAHGFAACYEAFRAVLDDETCGSLRMKLPAGAGRRFDDEHAVASRFSPKRNDESGEPCADDRDAPHEGLPTTPGA